MNIGVLGGTFDPVHRGHLAIAEEARARLKLGLTLFVPAGQPWLKPHPPVAAVEHRVAMVRLALEGKPYFRLSPVEVARAGPSYTVDTLEEMRGQLEEDDELFFILGQGSLAELPRWHRPGRLLELAYLVVASRPGYPSPDLKALEASLPGISERLMLMDRPELDISASAIRERVRQGLSIRHLVPEPVNRYIREHGLYLDSGGGRAQGGG